MKALVSILKRAQSLTSTISNDEEITQEVLDQATELDAELNELVTCGVCLCEFDTDNRKPKFLPCSHTICFLCLKVR